MMVDRLTNGMSLKARLWIGCGAMLVIIGATGVLSVGGLQRILSQSQATADSIQALATQADQIAVDAQQGSAATAEVATEVRERLLVDMQTSSKNLEVLEHSVAKIVNGTSSTVATIEGMLTDDLSPQEYALIEDLLFEVEAVNDRARKQAMPIVRRIVGSLHETTDRSAVAAASVESLGPVFEDFQATSVALQNNAESAREAADQSAALASSVRIWVLCAAAAGVIVGACIPPLIIRRIVPALQQVRDRSEEIAAGNLSGQPIPVKSGDEVGELTSTINNMSENLRSMVVRVREGATSVSTSAEFISTQTQDIVTGSETQLREVDQLGAAMEEMSMTSQEVASNCQDVAAQAVESGRVAGTGSEIVRGALGSMDDIGDSVGESSAKIEDLGDRVSKISDWVLVINDIAEQTNLLALNAAIEAARAGEYGRGFSVVADEVRKLADRTTVATTEITSFIDGIQVGTQDVIEQMRQGAALVDAGKAQSCDAGDNLDQIVNRANEMIGAIQTIASATDQQTTASEMISRGLVSIRSVCEASNASTTEVSASVTDLKQNACSLQELVNTFTVD